MKIVIPSSNTGNIVLLTLQVDDQRGDRPDHGINLNLNALNGLKLEPASAEYQPLAAEQRSVSILLTWHWKTSHQIIQEIDV
jgi:hypothetical protein